MITISGLSKSYGTVQALRDISLEFPRGGIYGVVGPNGAGKTTLFRCVAGLLDYTGGISFQLPRAKNQLGFLPTEPFFPSLLTGREYLQLMCNARQASPPPQGGNNVFGLPLSRFASSYSSGEKKKLALTGILLQKNEIYILDEPFNGVDIQSNMLISRIILRLKELGKTVLISSHILSTLADTCDSIVLLKAGQVERNFDREAFAEIEKAMLDREIGQAIESLRLD